MSLLSSSFFESRCWPFQVSLLASQIFSYSWLWVLSSASDHPCFQRVCPFPAPALALKACMNLGCPRRPLLAAVIISALVAMMQSFGSPLHEFPASMLIAVPYLHPKAAGYRHTPCSTVFFFTSSAPACFLVTHLILSSGHGKSVGLLDSTNLSRSL